MERHSRKPELAAALKEATIVINIQEIIEQQILRGVTALAKGGIKAVELPYTTIRNAGWFIQKLKDKGLFVGVGTITQSTHARESGAFGADFVTASVTTPDVVLRVSR